MAKNVGGYQIRLKGAQTWCASNGGMKGVSQLWATDHYLRTVQESTNKLILKTRWSLNM